MMRVCAREQAVARLDGRDLAIVELLARSRGAFSLSQYAAASQVSRQTAHERVKLLLTPAVLRFLPLPVAGLSMHLYFPARPIGELLAPGYLEPQTHHALLDACLRAHCAVLHGTEGWDHNARHASVLVPPSSTERCHVIDVLDRAPSAVFKVATERLPAHPSMTIHTGLAQRAEAFRLLAKRIRDRQSGPDECRSKPLTWNDLFPAQAVSREDRTPPPSSANLDIMWHDLPAFRWADRPDDPRNDRQHRYQPELLENASRSTQIHEALITPDRPKTASVPPPPARFTPTT